MTTHFIRTIRGEVPLLDPGSSGHVESHLDYDQQKRTEVEEEIQGLTLLL